MFDLTLYEIKILKKINTPAKVQDFLDTLYINYELRGETCKSPRLVLRERTAHCMEGAMLAALAFRIHGQKPLIMDLRANEKDFDHVVTLFRQHGCWGAVGKTNHAVLRYREPVYKTLRELAVSYFHEYFKDDGKKTLRSFSAPFNLSQFDKRGWMTSEKDLFFIPNSLDRSKHYQILPRGAEKTLRKADTIEIASGKLIEWNKRGKRLFKGPKIS